MTVTFQRYDRVLEGLPLIDVAGLRRGDRFQVARIADELGQAAREIGFFRITGHGIDPALIEATYQAAARFFARPEDFKQRYYIGHSRNHRGYVPFSEKGDYADEINRNYEAFDLGLDLPSDDPDFLSGNLILGPNVWPDLTGFKGTVSRYYAEISSLGRLVCSALELHLGLPRGAITDHMSKPISQLRLLHYVRENEATDHKSINMGAHTDYECLTLLHTRNEGLQVMTQEDRWIDVPVDHSVYVVNIGDMLEAWSNGLLRSTPHRVLNRSRERFSMPYFVAANHDTEIRPFPQLVGRGQPERYQPFLAGAHLERMLIRDFPYLRERRRLSQAAGLISPDAPVHNPFEHRINRSPTS
ncbi:isopenicillin N synthase family dioxygenase [Albidovulum sediminicola]|uniref:2-oxoglutarate-dependent ethylene/succinate-forming enzyme n=1 Tax=Albidovulum sediminicola TaxID=2984331 RepID=A0ABT2YY61_9RHOB|nr:2-oxoglutarate and iron-dependent oxygenase domain-containing protein [Defluviimonas sp. WL0075]MCV2863740.1 isopenicillin N synthase family oxygenase [Defluviimonas sp. WL0075]